MSLFSHFRFPRIEVMLGVCLLAFAGYGKANESPVLTSTAPAAIKQALQLAWRNHPDFRISESLLAEARARADAASRPLYNPELELVSDKEGSDRIATAGLSMAIDISGKRRARREAGTAQLRFEEAQAQLRRRDFAADWFNAWTALHSARQRNKVGNQRLALMNRFSELAEKQFKVGDISSLERDLAFLARDEAQTEQAGLLADLAEAEETFQNIGGLLNQEDVGSIDVRYLPSIDVQLPINIDTLPEWRLASANALAAERLIGVAEKDRIADPTVRLSSGRIDYGNVTDNFVGMSLSIPLQVRNSYRAEVLAAQAGSEAASSEADRVRFELQSRATRSAATYAAMQTAWQRWTASKGTSVESRSELLEKLWHAGELSTADYLLQLKQTLDTALSGAELEGRLWRSSTDYLSATGQLENWLGLDNANGAISP